MSSSQPTETRALAAAAAARGVRFVDAPVSGGVRGAEAGTLTIMAGGSEQRRGRVARRCSRCWARRSCTRAPSAPVTR